MLNGHHKTSKNTAGRRKGGQPGNKNGLRHGFYADIYTLKDGEELKKSVIEDEQAIMRFKAHRLAELTPLHKLNNKEINAIYCLCKAIEKINTIERTRMLARGRGGDIGADILQALRELNPDEEL